MGIILNSSTKSVIKKKKEIQKEHQIINIEMLPNSMLKNQMVIIISVIESIPNIST